MQEYFLNQRESLFPDVQVDIALTCLQYLSFNAFRHGDCEWWSPLYQYPFLVYAAVHWGHHVCRNEKTTLDMVQKFRSRKPNVEYATGILLVNKQHGLDGHRWDFGKIHLLSFFSLRGAMSRLLQINYSADSEDSRGQTPLSHDAT